MQSKILPRIQHPLINRSIDRLNLSLSSPHSQSQTDRIRIINKISVESSIFFAPTRYQMKKKPSSSMERGKKFRKSSSSSKMFVNVKISINVTIIALIDWKNNDDNDDNRNIHVLKTMLLRVHLFK